MRPQRREREQRGAEVLTKTNIDVGLRRKILKVF